MEMEQRIKNSKELLRVTFLAQGSKKIVHLKERVLEENGLGGSTFWDIICPLLKKEGLLVDYNDPNSTDSSFKKALAKELKHMRVLARFPISFSDDDSSKIKAAKLLELQEEFRKNYSHKFIVDEAKILEISGPTKLYFSEQKGITDDYGHKYPITGKNKQLVEALWELDPNSSLSSKDLQQEISFKDSSSLSKAVTSINKVFRESFNQAIHGLIENGGEGYYLNRDNFDLQALSEKN